MPALDVFAQDLIHKSMLFDHRETLEFDGGDSNGVHASATAGDVFDLVQESMLA